MRRGKPLFLSVLLLALVLLAGKAHGQQFGESVYVADSAGMKTDMGDIIVSGKVFNTLPWDVTDVEVTVIFDQGVDLQSDVVERIPAGEEESFRLVKEQSPYLQRYVAVVTQYTVQSNDVQELIRRYRVAAGDAVLQKAIQQAFSSMSDPAGPLLLRQISVDSRADGEVSLAQMLDDLMCLEGIRHLADASAVGPVLDLLAWYDRNDAIDLWPVKSEIAQETFTVVGALPILSGFDLSTVTMDQLVGSVLLEIGGPGVPELLRYATHDNRLVKNTVQALLDELDKASVEALLSEPDPEVLREIVLALGDSGRVDAVVPLLELAYQDERLSDAVDQSLKQMGVAAIPHLVPALQHTHLAVADCAERILRSGTVATVPALQEALSEQGLATAADDRDVDSLVTTLRAWADTAIEEKMEAAFERGWDSYRAGDCEAAYQHVEAMQAIRDAPSRHTREVAQVCICRAVQLADARDYDQAVELALQAEGLDPQNGAIRLDVGRIYHTWAHDEYEAGHPDEAVELLQLAIERDPANLSARQFMGRLVLRGSLLYLAIGAILVCAISAVGHFSARMEGAPHA
jgi:tetratricopeptide (TPR) repeat protein